MITNLDNLLVVNAAALRRSCSEVVLNVLHSVEAVVPEFVVNKKRITELSTSVSQNDTHPRWSLSPIYHSHVANVHEQLCSYKQVVLDVVLRSLCEYDFIFPRVVYNKSIISYNYWSTDVEAGGLMSPETFNSQIDNTYETTAIHRGAPPTLAEYTQYGYNHTRCKASNTTAKVMLPNIANTHTALVKLVKTELEAAYKRYTSKLAVAAKEGDKDNTIVKQHQDYIKYRFIPMLATYNKYSAAQKKIALNS